MDSIKQILILEDHKLALQILCDVTSEIFANAKIKTAVNISQAQQLLTQQKFDLALIDIALPDGNGIDIVKLINHQHPTTKIVITTILADDETIFNSLKAGAFGYLLKGYSKDELKEYLLKMLKGQPPISPTIAVKILSHFHQNNDNSLTKREKTNFITYC
jgi:DNA-binding NarL/FixJ family response regulator